MGKKNSKKNSSPYKSTNKLPQFFKESASQLEERRKELASRKIESK